MSITLQRLHDILQMQTTQKQNHIIILKIRHI